MLNKNTFNLLDIVFDRYIDLSFTWHYYLSVASQNVIIY